MSSGRVDVATPNAGGLQDTLLAAVDAAIASGELDRARVLVSAFRVEWVFGPLSDSAHRRISRLLDPAARPTPQLADVYWIAASRAAMRGDLAATKHLAEIGAGMAGALRDRVRLDRQVVFDGSLALLTGDAESAAEWFAAGIDRMSGAGDLVGADWARTLAAMALAFTGDFKTAELRAEEALRSSARLHAEAVNSLSFVRLLRGDRDIGTADLTAVLATSPRPGTPAVHGGGLAILAREAAREGRYADAAQLFGASDGAWESYRTRLAAFGPLFGAVIARARRDSASALGARRFSEAAASGRRQGVGVLRPRVESAPVTGKVTRREREIASLVAEGLTNREIAGRLSVSPRTVDGHLERIFQKLGVSSRARVAVWAEQQSLVSAGCREKG
jgi:DNA-binding CsgD family transcriptional regulator